MAAEKNDGVLEAKTNPHFKENFIKENRRFILTVAYRAVRHFVTESDDEYSIALIGFNEAIDGFESDKGDFYAFASLVIKRRLYDFIRTEARFNSEINVELSAMSGDFEDDEPGLAINREVRNRVAELAMQNAAAIPGNNPVKDEIEAISQLLSDYGFSFFDLTECSPKSLKTKNACAQAVFALLENEELMKRMQQTKMLPSKEIQKSTGVARKNLERHRKYIIAAAEILNGEYPLLAEYMSYIKEKHKGRT